MAKSRQPRQTAADQYEAADRETLAAIERMAADPDRQAKVAAIKPPDRAEPPPTQSSSRRKHPAITLRKGIRLALRQRRIKRPTALVGYILSEYVNRDSALAWPSNDALADELGIARDQVARHIAALARAGLIEQSTADQPKLADGAFTSKAWRVVNSPCGKNPAPAQEAVREKSRTATYRTRETEPVKGAARQVRLETWPLTAALESGQLTDQEGDQ